MGSNTALIIAVGLIICAAVIPWLTLPRKVARIAEALERLEKMLGKGIPIDCEISTLTIDHVEVLQNKEDS